MKILVLGGAGYIGSTYSIRTDRCWRRSVIIDNLETGHIRGSSSTGEVL